MTALVRILLGAHTFLAFFHANYYLKLIPVVEKSSAMTEQNLLVDLTFHDFPASLLKEFTLKIVKPYFKGNMDKAIKSLMEKTLTEESIVKKALNK